MRVYLAGPYTSDPATGVRNAILAASRLADAGHVPFVPHLSHFWHLLAPRPYESWISIDLHWLRQCEALIRLPGASKGADIEVRAARELGMRVWDGDSPVRDFLRDCEMEKLR